MAEFASAVHQENTSLLQKFITGTEKYRHHPYHRPDLEVEEIKKYGNSRLLRYPCEKIKAEPVLVIPSLINKSYILDLKEDFSFLRFLGQKGLTPYMLDWGDVTEEEKTYTFDDYFKNRLIPAMEKVSSEHGGKPVHVMGYCMGGTMALGLAWLKQDLTRSLTLIAAPWDFHAENQENALAAGQAYELMRPVVDTAGYIMPDMLQVFFTAVDPLFALQKFVKFADMDDDLPAAENFVAVEDWLNDGVPLVAGVAHTAFVDWYRDNETVINNWKILGQRIMPGQLEMPIHLVTASRDELVPPASALSFWRDIHPHSTEHIFDTGHIGLMGGGKAKTQVWPAIADWLSTF